MVIQEACVEYNDEVSNDEIINDLRILTNDYLIHQSGFINRIYFKGINNLWKLMIFFDTKENAINSMTNFQEWDKAKIILSKMKDNNTEFHHYENVDNLL